MSASVIAGFRLSAQQERIWMHEAGPAYRAACEVRIEGPLDLERLRQSIRTVVRRHEILRTVFHREAAVKLPFQVIRDSDAFAWRTDGVVDVAPFDLENGPALRVSIAAEGPLAHVMRLG